MRKIIGCCLLSLLLYTPILAQSVLKQTIKGVVLDEQSGNGLSSATVSIGDENFQRTVQTDSLGNFKIREIPVGRHNLKITRIGYEETMVRNIEVTSSKEVILEIKMKEKVQKLDEVVVRAGRQKGRAINEAALVSARQFSVDEAVRFSGTRNDPSRMAQNYAGVSGSNDARNDIIIRGNSPAGVLWRMEGIDIPNPNHYSTLGSTGGPVTILNTNNLKNSDFITSAFPAQYGNAVAGVFDLRLKNGNNEKFEFLGQMGFNGFEFGAEGPLNLGNKSSFIVNYRYSLIAAVQKLGLNVGTGSATPYYQDINFKVNLPTKKWGTFSWFGLGGESNIEFDAIDEDNLYNTADGSLRDRKFNSLTGVTGLTHTYFFDPNTSGKLTMAIAGFDSKYSETFYKVKPDSIAFFKKNSQVRFSVGYTFNKKIDVKNQLTAGVITDFNELDLRNDYIRNGDSVLKTFVNTSNKSVLTRGFVNYGYRFSDKLSTNLGLYSQIFTLNESVSFEPRWNLKYQIKSNQSISLGAGLHSQTQPLEVYFYETKSNNGSVLLTNKELDFVKSWHGVIGYDINFSRQLRFKAEVYGQSIFDAAVERQPSSFSMLNSGADFYFPDKTNLVNGGKGYNYGLELTLERFLHKGFYYLMTASFFNSQYQGSDQVWRNTAFNSGFATNALAGKEFKITPKISFGIDTKLAFAGGQRYTPFDLTATTNAGYIVFEEDEAYALKNPNYLRWDLKFSVISNGRKATQKWYIDLQNLTNRKNLYVRTLDPKDGSTGVINQIGFFPNVNYQITF